MRSKDLQPGAHDEADDLEALASELGSSAPEEDVEDDVDLDRLAAVAGARAPAAANASDVEAAVSEKLDLSAKPVTERPPSAAVEPPAQKAAPSKESTAPRAPNRLVPMLAVLAIGLGVLGYVLGRSSQPPSAPVASLPETSTSTVTPPPPSAQTAPPAQPLPLAPSVPSEPLAAAAPIPLPDVAAPAPAASAAARAGSDARPKPMVANAATRPATLTPVPQSPATEGVAEAAPVVRVEPSTEKEDAPPVAAKSTVDDLLDQALAPGARPVAEAAAPGLPEAPSREEVTQTMAVLLPAIRGCAMGQTGLATAGIVVRADGRVASVELSGAPFADTASGRCMEGVIRRARFTRFRQPTFRVRFPFAIQ